MENVDVNVNGTAAVVEQGADQGGLQQLLDGLEDYEGSSLGFEEAS